MNKGNRAAKKAFALLLSLVMSTVFENVLKKVKD